MVDSTKTALVGLVHRPLLIDCSEELVHMKAGLAAGYPGEIFDYAPRTPAATRSTRCVPT